MADNQFLQQFDEAMEQRGAIIGGEKVDVLTEDEVDDATTIPATKIDSTSGEAVGWYVAPLSVIMKPIRAAISTLQSLIETVTGQGNRAEQAAGRVDTVIATANTDHTRAEQDHSTAVSDHNTATSDHQTAQSDHTTAATDHTQATTDHDRADSDHGTATEDHTRADSDHAIAGTDHSTAKTDHTRADSDHTRAEQDHTDALEATAGAEKVNATLVGMTVTVTDRNGQSRSQNIGFEITEDHVYPSVAAMQADAANVLPGKFCMIATTDKTSEDNAQLWTRNTNAATSENPFTFLSDLDQAATRAFADWMENYKPVIESDHTRAEQDHNTATSDHTTAQSDHSTADADHTRAEQDHSTAGQDHTTAQGDHTRSENIVAHPPYIADGTTAYPGDAGYFYSWDYGQQTYVRQARLSLDWQSMSEAEREALAQYVLGQIAFDDVPTENSVKAVKSGGIYIALGGKQDKLVFATEETCVAAAAEIAFVPTV